MEYNWFNISTEERSKWESICPPDSYVITSGSTLSGLLPEDLIQKFNNVVVAGSATSTGGVYYLINCNRVDENDKAIDQMPFGFLFLNNNPSGCACLIQHGNWEGRTINPPSDFWDKIKESGISSYYPLSEMPKNKSGNINDLKIKSQKTAFIELIKALNQGFEE